MTKEQLKEIALTIESELYSEAFCNMGGIAAIEFATRLLAALPKPEPVEWPTMPPSKGQSHILFEDGYAEGWAKCLSMCKDAVLKAAHPDQSARIAELEQQNAELRIAVEETIDDLKKGFVVCEHCGSQEETSTLDVVDILEDALASAKEKS